MKKQVTKLWGKLLACWEEFCKVPEIPFGHCETCGRTKELHSQSGRCYFGPARTEMWKEKKQFFDYDF